MKRLGMVLLLVVAQAARAEEAAPVAAFETFLSSLDKADPASISAAIGYYTEHLAGTSQQERDDAGILFYEYVEEVVRAIYGVLSKAEADDWDYYVSLGAEIEPACQANGLAVGNCEGYFIEVSDAARGQLFRQVGQHMSPVLAAYFELSQQRMYCEGYLPKFPEVPGRLAATDAYLKAFPDSRFKENVEKQRLGLLNALLTGGPSYGGYHLFDRNGKALPATLEVYRKYVADHPGTSCAEVVSRYLVVLEKSGFAFSQEVYDFIATHAEGYHDSYAVLDAYFTPGNTRTLNELGQMASEGKLSGESPEQE